MSTESPTWIDSTIDFLTPGGDIYGIGDAAADVVDFFIPGNAFDTPLGEKGYDAWDATADVVDLFTPGDSFSGGSDFVSKGFGLYGNDASDSVMTPEAASVAIRALREKNLDPEILKIETAKIIGEYKGKDKETASFLRPSSWDADMTKMMISLGLGVWQIEEQKKQHKEILKMQSPEAQAAAEVAYATTRERLYKQAGFDYYGRPLSSGGGGGGGGGGGAAMAGFNVFK